MIHRLWPFWHEPHELAKVSRCVVLAMKGHDGQTRKYSGLPYVTHPLRVAMAVASYPQADLSWVCAGLCHDLVEGTSISYEEIIEASDDKVAVLVRELTNVSPPGMKLSRVEQKKLDWQRLAGVSRPAKIIKMHDRIDNLRDMVNAPVSFKKMYAEESLELLNVIGEADKDMAVQFQTAVDYLYKWRMFTIVELRGKPVGTVLEHSKFGECWIEDGKLKFADGSLRSFDDEDVEMVLMRETGAGFSHLP